MKHNVGLVMLSSSYIFLEDRNLSYSAVHNARTRLVLCVILFVLI
jgi:hypothetical protein